MQAGLQYNNHPTNIHSYSRALTGTASSELSLNGCPGQGVGEDPGVADQGCNSLLVHSVYKLLQLPKKFSYAEDLLMLKATQGVYTNLWTLIICEGC